jgi:hypothetical protein
MEVYKDQVRQFSITIVQLEKNFQEEQEKRMKLQTDFDDLNKNGKSGHYIILPFAQTIEMFFFLSIEKILNKQNE